MLDSAQRFPFTQMDDSLGEASLLPMLPITLTYKGRALAARGLLDTGSIVNVLPYGLGAQLGADWEQQTTRVRLTGNLALAQARILIVSGAVGQFPPVRLAFAWTRTTDVPLILGQVNFLKEFDAYFSRCRSFFDIRPAS